MDVVDIDETERKKFISLSLEKGMLLKPATLLSLSAEHVKRAIEILRIFGLHEVYDESDLPLLDGKKALNLF